jgi:hypothetical protein
MQRSRSIAGYYRVLYTAIIGEKPLKPLDKSTA